LWCKKQQQQSKRISPATRCTEEERGWERERERERKRELMGLQNCTQVGCLEITCGCTI